MLFQLHNITKTYGYTPSGTRLFQTPPQDSHLLHKETPSAAFVV